MDYSRENEIEREYYKKDFSPLKELLLRIRMALLYDTNVDLLGINLDEIIKYDENYTYVYITLFQEGLKPIRWGSCRKTFGQTINRNVEKIKNYSSFKEFDVGDTDKCRIMFEIITDQLPVKLEDIKYGEFSDARFEPGVSGLKLVLNGVPYIYTPTDAWTLSQMDLKSALNTILRKTHIKNITNKISERINILKQAMYDLFIIKSHAFITYQDSVLPLYRGNVLYEYSPEDIRLIALSGADWIVKYQKDDGRYLYYYDAKEDNYKDHEHPNAPSDNLYYNDLRHCGGIITLIRAYQLTGDEKYIISAKKGIDFITSITKEHKIDGQVGAYVFYNNKAKLGGTGMILIAMMKYRSQTGDKSYDDYIKKYTRHLISRIHKTGEMLGYYIHPLYNDGKPLIDLDETERRATFSFYYPGEALLGLGLFVNQFEDDELLRSQVIEKCKIALDWIVDERPTLYSDLFTALPSDAWLMQAIEEWVKNPEFRKDNLINFVFNDAKVMIEKTYQKDDSPYIDYEGGYYYNYGDHFYPDGSRSEGLIAAYYLAKRLENTELADEILEVCRKTAQSQMLLYNSEKNIYAHKNPQKSKGAIRFKATRQWIRVDSIQHVACFYFRLYFAENNIEVL